MGARGRLLQAACWWCRLTRTRRVVSGVAPSAPSARPDGPARSVDEFRADRHPAGPAGRVVALTVKPQRKQLMVRQPVVRAVASRGLGGDCHAQALGPRQVLLVRQEDLDRHGLVIEQVRANIAVVGLDAEQFASGAVLRIGETLVRVTHQCEVCKVLREYVPAGVFRELPGERGSLGVFLEGGVISVADDVVVQRERFVEVPEGIYDRLAWVLSRVPAGRVVTYATLISLVGASKPYFRVLPTYLRRAAGAGLPAHRVLTSAAALTGHLDAQARKLAREGVEMAPDGVLVGEDKLWDGRHVYGTAEDRLAC